VPAAKDDPAPADLPRDAAESAASLERTAYGLNMVGFILWTFTLVAGAIWAQKAWGSYWTWDPKEVWTFVVWVVYAAYMHARATAGWEPRKAMWIAIAGFVTVVVNFAVVNVFFVGQHSYSGLWPEASERVRHAQVLAGPRRPVRALLLVVWAVWLRGLGARSGRS
jgi:hypothetical protein